MINICSILSHHHFHQQQSQSSMKRRLCYSLVLLAAFKIITCVPVTTGPSFGFLQKDLFSQGQVSDHIDSQKQGHDGEVKKLQLLEEMYNRRELSRLGSRPPNCAHKCRGCVPCDAFQIPATSDYVTVEYANYEPEGWKCKCGTTFFNP